MCVIQICEAPGFTRVYNEEAKVPYMYSDEVWIGYDDLESIGHKVRLCEGASDIR